MWLQAPRQVRGCTPRSPDISALLTSHRAPGQRPSGDAFEISPPAARLAATRAAAAGLADVYAVHNGCFWSGAVRDEALAARCLIANPPYIAAPGGCVGVCVPAREAMAAQGGLARGWL